MPFAVRAEARLFLDLGQVARLTASLLAISQDDVPKFFSGAWHQYVASVGIHSDF